MTMLRLQFMRAWLLTCISGSLLAATAASQVARVPYTRVDRPQLANTASWNPSSAAALVGLDSLSRVALPPGYRELRVELDCSACTPFYLIRIVQSRRGGISGEGYIFWSAADSTGGADSTERAYTAMVAQESARLGCKIRTAGGYTYCKVHRGPGQWAAILDSLDSLGLQQVGADTGYAPDPPRPVSGRGSIQDTLTGRWWLGMVCRDIGSQSIIVESLTAATYRNAAFRCLESPGASRTEQWRMASAQRLLERLFWQSR